MILGYMGLFPEINLSKTAITAITRRICIRPPAWKPKNPIAQAIINITAIV